MEQIFSIWPTLAALAKDLGKPYPTVASWRQRGSIPAKYDFALVKAAERRGHSISFEQIAEARAVAEGMRPTPDTPQVVSNG